MAKGKYQRWLADDGLVLLEAWARDGLTDEQIAGNIGINPSTLYDWMKKHPEISNALKRGKEVVDIQVENALLKRALGYPAKETIIEKRIDEKTGVEMKVTKVTEKEIPPDVTAQIFWLKNRKPVQWRDKRDMSVEGSLDTKNPFSKLTTEELRKLIEHG